MERKKSINIFSAVALFLYISAIVFFCISLRAEYQTAEQHVENRFKKLAKNTADAYKMETKNTATFTNSMLQIINSTSDVASVFVTNGGETIFEWPQNGTLENTSPLIKSCSTVIAQDVVGNVTLTASLYVLKPESIYKTAKISFIVVLAATLCTVVFFVYINIASSIPNEKPFTDIKNLKRNPPEMPSVPLSNDKTIYSDVKTFSPITTMPTLAPLTMQDDIEEQISEPVDEQPSAVVNNAESTFEPISIIDDPESVEKTFSTAARLNETFTLENETVSEMTQTPYTLTTETFSGLPLEANNEVETAPSFKSSKYSPFTGFCWESFIDVATEEELQLSTAEGKDVSLMFMRIAGLDRMDYISENIRSVIFSAIGNRDLIFEYKNDGYAVLLPQTDIDGGIKIAEMIEPKVSEILQIQNVQSQLMIGIAARTGRFISASVLHDEAEKALAHAEPSLPLIAFRVDPEKYREFVEQTQG